MLDDFSMLGNEASDFWLYSYFLRSQSYKNAPANEIR
jgi:hypothetical protein